MLKKMLNIARIDHWGKNVFIIPGMVLACFFMNNFNIGVILKLLCSFLATCFAASANYIINEYLDKDFDKYHPTKKNRTLVTESIKFRYIVCDYCFFAIISLLISYKISITIFYCIIWLLVMGMLYNVPPIRTKDIPYIDVLSESVNNIIRLLIGWLTVTESFLPPISAVIGYWMVGAFLMAVKRYAEYRMISDKKIAYLYRKSFKYYDEIKLLLLSVFCSIMAVFFCGIFVIKYSVELVLCIPFVAILFCYYLSLSYKPDSSVQKPEKLYKEKKLMLYCVFLFLVIIVLLNLKIPELEIFLTNELVQMVI